MEDADRRSFDEDEYEEERESLVESATARRSPTREMNHSHSASPLNLSQSFLEEAVALDRVLEAEYSGPPAPTEITPAKPGPLTMSAAVAGAGNLSKFNAVPGSHSLVGSVNSNLALPLPPLPTAFHASSGPLFPPPTIAPCLTFTRDSPAFRRTCSAQVAAEEARRSRFAALEKATKAYAERCAKLGEAELRLAEAIEACARAGDDGRDGCATGFASALRTRAHARDFSTTAIKAALTSPAVDSGALELAVRSERRAREASESATTKFLSSYASRDKEAAAAAARVRHEVARFDLVCALDEARVTKTSVFTGGLVSSCAAALEEARSCAAAYAGCREENFEKVSVRDTMRTDAYRAREAHRNMMRSKIVTTLSSVLEVDDVAPGHIGGLTRQSSISGSSSASAFSSSAGGGSSIGSIPVPQKSRWGRLKERLVGEVERHVPAAGSSTPATPTPEARLQELLRDPLMLNCFSKFAHTVGRSSDFVRHLELTAVDPSAPPDASLTSLLDPFLHSEEYTKYASMSHSMITPPTMSETAPQPQLEPGKVFSDALAGLAPLFDQGGARSRSGSLDATPTTVDFELRGKSGYLRRRNDASMAMREWNRPEWFVLIPGDGIYSMTMASSDEEESAVALSSSPQRDPWGDTASDSGKPQHRYASLENGSPSGLGLQIPDDDLLSVTGCAGKQKLVVSLHLLTVRATMVPSSGEASNAAPSLELWSPKQPAVILRAETKQERDEWLEAIKTAAEDMLMDRRHPHESHASSTAEAAASLIADCGDCRASNAGDWVSVSLGTRLCIACSGVHRSLGVHVSRILSLKLDDLSPERRAMLAVLGNDVANGVLERNIPPERVPSPSITGRDREEFIRKKYVELAWADKRPVEGESLAAAFDAAIRANDLATVFRLVVVFRASPATRFGEESMIRVAERLNRREILTFLNERGASIAGSASVADSARA